MKMLMMALCLAGLSGCQLMSPTSSDAGGTGGCSDGAKLCPPCGQQAMCCTQKQSCQCTAGTPPIPYCR